jgi:biofilm PGA synthesis N-glycosyltransferase PgaC
VGHPAARLRFCSVFIVLIAPFLNEGAHLPAFLDSVAGQTRRPDRLILVDDGSSDDSYDRAAEFANTHEFATALRRPARPGARDRLADASEYRAFQWALEHVEDMWDVAAKVDPDLELTPRTIETIERELEDDPKLGLAGSYLREEGASGELTRIRIRAEHVHGATKFYRRECWEAIAPMDSILGWDMIDEVKAGMAGWRTQSFDMPDGDPIHMRKRGGHDGLLRGYRRWGAGAWAMGEHPLHVVLLGLRQTKDRPWVVGGLGYIGGWAWAGLRRRPRADAAVRAEVRRGQLERIRKRLWGKQGRTSTAAG